VLTIRHSTLIRYLSDVYFPSRVFGGYRAQRYPHYQELYRQYSRLEFSNHCDRPLAIASLQQRLLRATDAQGCFGVFDERKNRGALRRSLLWTRSSKSPMLLRIKLGNAIGASFAAPSWSWMAYTGEIDYLHVPYGGVVWEDIVSPWDQRIDEELSGGDEINTGGNSSFKAVAFEYNVECVSADDYHLVYDDPGARILPRQNTPELLRPPLDSWRPSPIREIPEGVSRGRNLCVVLGKDILRLDGRKLERYGAASTSFKDRRHYVLLVALTSHDKRAGENRCTRIGVGILPQQCLSICRFKASIW
jgi:hypothetical protein